jgi:Zn finger protein HypA/HybF involved in hydrogenase expression
MNYGMTHEDSKIKAKCQSCNWEGQKGEMVWKDDNKNSLACPVCRRQNVDAVDWEPNG